MLADKNISEQEKMAARGGMQNNLILHILDKIWKWNTCYDKLCCCSERNRKLLLEYFAIKHLSL